MAPPQKHRVPIIEAALRLFRQNGYAATGVNDIVDQSGAPKGSLYYHFPQGKPSIAVAAIEEAGRRAAATLSELADTAASPGELVKAHAVLLGKWMAKSNFRDGCPMTTVLLELAPQDRAISEAGRNAYAARNAVLAEALTRSGFAPSRARGLALLATSALQGALVQSRVERSAAPLQRAAEEVARYFESEAAH